MGPDQYLVVFVVGCLVVLSFVAWTWLVVRAFRTGSFGWGAAMTALTGALAVVECLLPVTPLAAGLAALSVPSRA